MTRTSTDKRRAPVIGPVSALVVASSISGLRPPPSRTRARRRCRPAQAPRPHGLARIHRLRRQQNPVPASHAPHRTAPPQDLDPQREDPRRTPRPGCACSFPWTRTSPPAWRSSPRRRRFSISSSARSNTRSSAKKKIYIYGCGATGRLAKQMESSFWRPFWRKVKAEADLWAKCRSRLDPAVEDGLIGEMTGARPGPHQLARRLRRPSAHRPASAP